MEKLKAAICDDEVLVLPHMEAAVVKAFLARDFQVEADAFSVSGHLWNALCSGEKYDLFFLDIDIPDCNGIETAQKLRTLYPDAVVLFVSAREDMVFQTFQVSPAAFVRKSHFEEDLETSVDNLVSRIFRPKEKFYILKDALGHELSVNLDKLLYIEAKDKYVNLVMVDGEQLIRQTISVLEEKLKEWQFIRTHKSYLVNHRFIYKLVNKKVILDNGEAIPVSRYRMASVKSRFCIYSR